MDKQGHQSALLLHKNGEYDKAFSLFLEESKKDNAQAMANIGMMYLRGEGVMKDLGQARQWFEKAASLDNASALYNLSLMYENAIGLTQDSHRADTLLHAAAKHAHEGANYKLALLYLQDKSDAEALKKGFGYMMEAAKLGHLGARAQLGGYDGEDKNTLKPLSKPLADKTHKKRMQEVETVLDTYIRPVLANDGGNVVVAEFIVDSDGYGHLRLCYSGNCEGCHLGATSTYAMIQQLVHEKIDPALKVYVI